MTTQPLSAELLKKIKDLFEDFANARIDQDYCIQGMADPQAVEMAFNESEMTKFLIIELLTSDK